MSTLLVAVGTFVAYLLAYHTYGRWLSRKVFQLDPQRTCPSVELEDGRDYVPTRRSIVFGHHFTSIAGTGPIVGPAIAVFWGWLPALIWVLVGSIFIGAVHDFGALVISLRNRGQTIGDVAARMINPRARILFLVILFLALTVVIGIFGLVIAVIFATYPGSVFPVWIQIPIAVTVGWLVYRRGGSPLVLGVIALLVMYVTIAIGVYVLPISLTAAPFHLAASGSGLSGAAAYGNAVVAWTIALLVYCFIASVLPVWTLLQPRDFINSQQLLVALVLLFAGLLITPLLSGGLEFVAPMVNSNPPADAPPIWPFLFITIACGAISGFHCLVSSGTTSKQLRSEGDAQFVGYGSMLLEGGLAVIVILACTAGIGRGIYTVDAASGGYTALVDSAGVPITGVAAWEEYYGAGTWAGMGLRKKIGGFVEGGANMLGGVGVPITLGIGVMAVLVACFAATTLDTATRLQRYVITELGEAVGLRALRNRYLATTVAVVSGGAIAMISGPAGPGSGGLILWPIFGATNQLLAGLSFIVIAFYLLRHGRPVWFLVLPLLLMLVLPNWAMVLNLRSWWQADGGPQWVLIAFGGTVMLLQIWMVVEAAVLWRGVRGVLPASLSEQVSTYQVSK